MSHSASHSALRARRGFTLIELLVSVVIVGILASFAMLGFQNTKGKAAVAAMKSDLRNLAQTEESHFATHATYTDDMVVLLTPQTPGVTVSVVAANSVGWGATATHGSAPGVTCALYYGLTEPVAPATREGSIRCE